VVFSDIVPVQNKQRELETKGEAEREIELIWDGFLWHQKFTLRPARSMPKELNN